MSDFGVAPTFVDFNSPSLNSNIVGIPLTPYLVGVFGSSSILCFAIVISLVISFDISSKIGPIILKGPHHYAQKSNTIGFEDFKTSASKFSSFTFIVAISFIYKFISLIELVKIVI